jgi:UDP-N-acetylmuramoylalanine--D-glutamate ligase
MTFEALANQGQETVYQSLAASIGPKIREIRKQFIKESFYGFQEFEHRMETVLVIKDMEFINDSRSSTLNSTWYALESTSRPIIWIVGGVDSGNDFTTLRNLVRTKVKGMICLGLDTTRIHNAFEGLDIPVIDALTMEEAVQAAYYMGNSGDAVLLSPACPSFDLYDNYEERGIAFRKAVKNL